MPPWLHTRILAKDELAGVMAHELAHVQHRDILISSIAATIAAAIVMVSRFALFFGGRRGRGSNPIVAIAMMILAPMAAMIIKAAISRAREFAADARGAEIAGRPDGLANALRRMEAHMKQRPAPPTAVAQAAEHMYIMKPFSGGGVLKLFSSHPPTDQRIARLMGR